MRTTRLLGILFVLTGVYVATRGAGWSGLYILAGFGFAFIGALLLSRRRVHRFRVRMDDDIALSPLAAKREVVDERPDIRAAG